jgi:DNA-directed RNA polymerase specialized sigma24 family protein
MSTHPAHPRRSAHSTNPRHSTPPRHPLVHPDVLLAIACTLRKRGVRKDDVPDGVAEVQARSLESTRNGEAPTDTSGWAKLCTTIATCFAVDEGRKKAASAKLDAGLCGTPDDHGPLAPSGEPRDPVDARRQMAVLETLASAEQLRILASIAAGMTHKEIAEDLGISEQAVRDRLVRLRARFRMRLAALGMTALLVLMAVLLAAPLGGVALLAPGSVPPRAPTQTPAQTPAPTAVQLASVLRQDALRACAAGEWATCVSKLDGARLLDPAGDATPEVAFARRSAQAALYEDEREMEAKPR